MRVLHLDTGNEYRGGQVQMEHLVRRQRGEVHLALPVNAPLMSHLAQSDITLHPIDFGRLWRRSGQLKEVIETVKPDLIAAHTSNAHGLALRASGGVPVVVHRRVDFQVGRTPWGRRKYRGATGFVAVSQAVAQILITGGVPPEQVVVVHDGVDPLPIQNVISDRTATRQSLGVTPDTPVIIAAGALVAHKDHQTLISAAKHLKNACPEVRVFIAGEGELRLKLEQMIDRLGLQSTVTLLGQRSDLIDLMRASDIFCHCSEEEGMGSVVVEAMMAGTPIVATAAGGVVEVVIDKETGLLSPVSDPEELAKTLETALGSGDKMAAWSNAARDRALQYFSVTQMVSQTELAYERFTDARFK